MITKSELIEYLKHTPENTNYNVLYSSLYNGSNKEVVDEFIEVLSHGNLSLAALQPYLAKLYEDDKTISPEPLPPFSIGDGVQPDWNQNDDMQPDYIKNRPFYEEVKVFAEGDITDDSSTLPEGKYELGKIYVVEVDGVQYQLEFMSAKSGEGRYYVGFNIGGTRYGVTYIDSTKPWLSAGIGTASPSDGLYSVQVANITKPAHVRVFQQDLHKIDSKYIPFSDFDFDISLVTSGVYYLTNLAQVQKAIDNSMTVNIVYSTTNSGFTACYKATLPCIKDCMTVQVASGGQIIGNLYESPNHLFLLEVYLNYNDYQNGIMTPTSASLHVYAPAPTLVKCYASPF